MESVFENKYAYFRITNTIVFVRCRDNVTLDLEMAMVITSDRIRLQSNKSYPVFFEMSGVLGSDKFGRDYLAKYGWLLASSVGICSTSEKSLAIASFYLYVTKPVVPTRLFRNEKQAITFLETAK